MSLHLVTLAGRYVDILPHMLEHYRSLGVDSFFVNLHLSSADDPVREQVEAITARFGCGIASTFIGAWQDYVQHAYALQREKYPSDWFLLADQDELQFYPAGLHDVIADCAASGYDYMRGCFVDRIAADCRFPELQPGVPIREQFPLGGFVSNPIMGADPRKVVAVRGNLPVVKGQHHAAAGRACPTRLYYIPVHHFKWTAGVAARLSERAEMMRRRGVAHWTESAYFVEYHEKSGGRFNAADPNLYIAPAEPEYRHWETVKKIVLRFPIPGS